MVRFNWRRFAKWIALATFLFLAGVVMLIHLDPVQQFILRRAEGIARTAGYPFTAQHLRFRPFELQAFLTGFVYANNDVRVEADALQMEFPWKVLTLNEVVLAEWAKRCGPECAAKWTDVVGKHVGLVAKAN